MYVNYEKFWLYSLYDTYRLYQLEESNKDVDLMFGMAEFTTTRFNKVMQKTTSIRNFAASLLFKEGYVLSNNRNRFNERPENKEKFRGALVMPPENMLPVGIDIGQGKKSSYIFKDSIDEDLTAMYPSIIISSNYDSNTMLGKIYCRADKIFEDKISDYLIEANLSTIGNKFLGLPTFDKILVNLEHYMAD